MIVTVTLNPSIDISYPIETLKIDQVNRVKTVSKTAGGKGLNVTRVLHLLDQPVTATGFIGGNLGNFILDQLEEDGIQHQFTQIDGENRLSIAILHDDHNQTEILEPGPTLNDTDLAHFKKDFRELCQKASLITLSGSLPKGLPTTTYSQLIAIAHEEGVPCILDSSGETLRASLEADYKPIAIKPNETEIAQLIGKEFSINDFTQVKSVLESDLFAGIEWIIVSLGADGAFAKHNEDYYRVHIPNIKVVNPVGSGDSTVAGLAFALDHRFSPEDTLKLAMTTGMLNTMEAKTGHINPTKVEELMQQVTVENI